jgi:large subunit ribosomal protein L21
MTRFSKDSGGVATLEIESKGVFLMFAVLKTGGKQYKVIQGDLIEVEKLESDVGDKVTLDQVLMVGEGEDVEVGSPYIPNCQVTGEVVKQGKGAKIIVFKKKRRKNYRRKNGHRQFITQLKITEISKK